MLDSQRLQIRMFDKLRSKKSRCLNEISGLEGDAVTSQSQFAKNQDNLTQPSFEKPNQDTGRRRSSKIRKHKKGAPLDSETVELQRLTERASVGDILSATFENRQTSGEAAELQQHYGLGSHQVPLEMLRIDRGVEERAAATVPDSIGDASQAQVITPIFASGDGAFLGIERPTVPVGDAAYPVLSTLPSVKGPFTNSSEAVQTDATFVANGLSRPNGCRRASAIGEPTLQLASRVWILRSAWHCPAGLRKP